MSSVNGVVVLAGAPASSDAEAADGDWFDASAYLGARGTRLLPRGAQLTAACSTLLARADGLGAVPDERRGIWVATSTFAEQMHEEMDAVIRQGGAMELSPIQAPFFSVNLVVGRASKDANGKGMTATITTPHTGFADALAAASAALARGRVDRALVACTEVAGPAASGDDSAEGCVSLLLERAQAASTARISVNRGFALDAQQDLYGGATPATGAAACQGRHLIFTDRKISDPVLHAIVDLDGECIDAELRPLERSMIPQALAVAELASSGDGGCVTVVSAVGQWARIQVTPPGMLIA